MGLLHYAQFTMVFVVNCGHTNGPSGAWFLHVSSSERWLIPAEGSSSDSPVGCVRLLWVYCSVNHSGCDHMTDACVILLLHKSSVSLTDLRISSAVFLIGPQL